MDTFLHILGWILLLAPFIVVFVFIAKVFGLALVLIILGSVFAFMVILALAFWLISY